MSVDVKRQFLGFCLRVHLMALLLDGPYGGEKSARVHLLALLLDDPNRKRSI